MNIKDSNKDFQDISKCNLNLHWSYSNWFRHLWTASYIESNFNEYAVIYDIACGDAPVYYMLKDNFNFACKNYNGVDAKYFPDHPFEFHEGNFMSISEDNFADVVIFTEAIEHLEPVQYTAAIKMIRKLLKPKGKMILSTPTPIKQIEDRVWPTDHEHELSVQELSKLVNKYFMVDSMSSWSMTTREYNSYLQDNAFARKIYHKLTGMPSSFKRAVISMTANLEDGRQTIMACESRKR